MSVWSSRSKKWAELLRHFLLKENCAAWFDLVLNWRDKTFLPMAPLKMVLLFREMCLIEVRRGFMSVYAVWWESGLHEGRDSGTPCTDIWLIQCQSKFMAIFLKIGLPQEVSLSKDFSWPGMCRLVGAWASAQHADNSAAQNVCENYKGRLRLFIDTADSKSWQRWLPSGAFYGNSAFPIHLRISLPSRLCLWRLCQVHEWEA